MLVIGDYEGLVIYLVVVVVVDGIKCRVLLDIVVGSLYVLVVLVEWFSKFLIYVEYK